MPETVDIDQILRKPDYPFASSQKDQLEPEYAETFKAWKADPTPENNAKILNAVKPVLSTAATMYGANSPILRTHAKTMALDALNSYDPQKGSIRTHLLSNLRSLQRLNAQTNQIIGIPERVAIQKNMLESVQNELVEELGRLPTTVELASKTGLSPKRLSYLRQAHSGINTGRLVDADGELFTLNSALPNDNSINEMWTELVYNDLDPTDKFILEHSLGLYNAPTLSTAEIAKKLSISPSAVSQRKAKIQEMLDERWQ